MKQTVAQIATQKLEAASSTFDRLPDWSGCPGSGETLTNRAEKNRRAFIQYMANDVFQAASDRAKASGVPLDPEQVSTLGLAAISLVSRDAAWWSNRSKDWGKLLMDEVRS